MAALTHLIPSPLGELGVEIDAEGRLKRLTFDTEDTIVEIRSAKAKSTVEFLKKQLDDYFHGKLRAFNIPLAPEGTDFQKRVWNELLQIPYGRTSSYGELAEKLGGPKLTRAVGGANGANPIAILIPCHRVIGADGSLTGYGGGMERKEELLRIEGLLPHKLPAEQPELPF